MSACVCALIEKGTSWIVEALFVAVTMTSPYVLSAVWATACVGTIAVARAAAPLSNILFVDLIFKTLS